LKSILLRALVAVLAIPLVLYLTFNSDTLAFKVVVLAVLTVALLEVGQMAKGKPTALLYFSGMYFLFLFWMPASGIAFLARMSLPSLLFLGLLLLFAEFLLWRRPLAETVPATATTFFSAFYFGILGSYFLLLRRQPEGPWHLMVLFVATWAYDTGGYFAGRTWGRHKLAQSVSPKKTWEGCAGGVVLAVAALLVFRHFAPVVQGAYRIVDLLVLGLLLSFFGQAGDLIESMIKRSFAAKDSGSLLPGHGGMFDRIDSLLFNAPVLYFYIQFILRART